MIFLTTLSQMGYLFLFVAVGFILSKFKFIPQNAETVLSKLETYLFIPALMLGTFMTNFTVEKLTSYCWVIVASVGLQLIAIGVSYLCSRFCTKDNYLRKIYYYGLCFSNFGFMGNAVVYALFPTIFTEYLLFTLIMWIFINVWGAPSLLLSDDEPTPQNIENTENGESLPVQPVKKKFNIKARLKTLLNPMLICSALGIILGLCAVPMPKFITDAVQTAGDCMSPVAMLLTGMTIAKINLKTVLKVKSIYLVSALRLLIYPFTFIGIYAICKLCFGWELPAVYVICAVSVLAMPLGLNTIVIPGAYGKDTTAAAGMALVSHVLSIGTIPLVYTVLQLLL